MQHILKQSAALILALATLPAKAQKTEFGFIAGPQATSAHYSVHKRLQQTSWLAGGHIGAIASIPFEANFYFTPSLVYSLKGYGVSLADTSSNPGVDAIANTLRLHTIELTPLFTLYFGNKSLRPFIQFGPSLDMNISGTEKLTLKNGSTLSRNVNFSGDAYGRITASLVFRFGFETSSGLFANAHYEHGFGSLNQNDFGPYITHRVVGVSVGKFFRRN
jgi:hypothetical protein